MKYISLFSGIGGFDLGFDRAGMECVLQVEKDEKARAVLAHHWPNVPRMELVEDVTRDKIRQLGIETVDLICGGFPCQDISEANTKGKGLKGKQSSLWWEYYRVICELRPRYAVMENVSNLVGRGLGVILGELAQIGYDAEWQTISASSLGAPHTRERLFIVAYPNGQYVNRYGIFDGGNLETIEAQSSQWLSTGTGRGVIDGQGNRRIRWIPNDRICRVVDRVPGRVDGYKQLGNAVVPQVSEWIGRRIMAQ